MMVDVWQAFARAPGRRLVELVELGPIVRAAMWTGDFEAIDGDLNEGDPGTVLAYVGTALVQVELARLGWRPPPALIWAVN